MKQRLETMIEVFIDLYKENEGLDNNYHLSFGVKDSTEWVISFAFVHTRTWKCVDRETDSHECYDDKMIIEFGIKKDFSILELRKRIYEVLDEIKRINFKEVYES